MKTMLSFTTAQHDAIADLCRRFHVERLEVFGSATQPDFDSERSDLDFLVRFPTDYDFGPWMARLQLEASETDASTILLVKYPG